VMNGSGGGGQRKKKGKWSRGEERVSLSYHFKKEIVRMKYSLQKRGLVDPQGKKGGGGKMKKN